MNAITANCESDLFNIKYFYYIRISFLNSYKEAFNITKFIWWQIDLYSFVITLITFSLTSAIDKLCYRYCEDLPISLSVTFD